MLRRLLRKRETISPNRTFECSLCSNAAQFEKKKKEKKKKKKEERKKEARYVI